MFYQRIILIAAGLAVIIYATFLFYNRLALAPTEVFAVLQPPQIIEQLTVKEAIKAQQISVPRQPTGYFAPILTFHYIATTSETDPAGIGLHVGPAEFEKILKELQKNKYQTVFASTMAAELARGQLPPKNWVALTFDDGYEDFYTNALPLLKKYHDQASLFIITAASGANYLTGEQIKEIDQSGLVEIGSHTVNHLMLSKLSPQIAGRELISSKIYLEKLLGKPVDIIGYPYGDYSAKVEELAKASGYKYGFTYNHRPLQDSADMFAIDRASVWPEMNVINFLENLQAQNDRLKISSTTAEILPTP